MSVKSVLISSSGASVVESKLRTLKEGDVLLSHTSIGFSRYDVEVLKGGRLPVVYPTFIGSSAVGVVEESNCSEFSNGERVFYCYGPVGALSEKRVINGKFLNKYSGSLTDDALASIAFSCFSAIWFIDFFSGIPSNAYGINIMVNGVTGRIGKILLKILLSRGASVYAMCRDGASVERAMRYGCNDAFDINSGIEKYNSLMNTVFDFLGGVFLHESIPCIGRHGSLISVGSVCGENRLITADEVRQNSIYIRCPSIGLTSKWGASCRKYVDSFMKLINSRVIRVDDPVVYSLADFAKASDYITNERNGKYVVLKPV